MAQPPFKKIQGVSLRKQRKGILSFSGKRKDFVFSVLSVFSVVGNEITAGFEFETFNLESGTFNHFSKGVMLWTSR